MEDGVLEGEENGVTEGVVLGAGVGMSDDISAWAGGRGVME